MLISKSNLPLCSTYLPVRSGQHSEVLSFFNLFPRLNEASLSSYVICSSSLMTLVTIHLVCQSLLCTGGPKMGHKCQEEVKNHFALPAVCTVSNLTQDAVGLRQHKYTLLIYFVQVFTHHSPLVLLFYPACCQPVFLHEVILLQRQDFKFVFSEFHEY